MTIHLPEDVENAVRAKVLSGYFPSEDALVAAAVRYYLGRYEAQALPERPAASEVTTDPDHKPIWEVIEEENRSIPPEVWDALPADLSEQHDHYIYSTPKRPVQ
jgi:Arc/MetJ-type ribon-helix-helix transcriptional regulator